MKFKNDNIFIFYIITIFLSFIIWCFVRIDTYETKIKELENKKHYVEIEELKTKIKFEAKSENTYIIKDFDMITKWEVKKIKE